jgi:nucleotide-binding universal stress UspA family protein
VRAICDVADEVDAAMMWVGARGMYRLESLLLGSASSGVTVHAKRAPFWSSLAIIAVDSVQV